MKLKMKNKVIAFAMSLAMVFTMMPIMGAPVYADDTAPAAPGIALGSDVLSVGSNTSGAATVHMADKTWRVIGYDGSGVASSASTMTLLSAGILKKDVVFREYIRDEGSDSWYHQSVLQSEVEAIANTFSAGEQAGIATRNLKAGDYNGYDTDTVSRYSVSNARLWPLSTKEAYYTLNGDIRNVNDFWWLRSPGHTAPPYFTCHISYVKIDGNVDEEGCLVTEKNGVRPAFYYKLNSVIFTSAAEGGKVSGSVGADALVQVGNNTNNEWKVTVKNGHDSFAVGSVTTCDKKILNIKYSGAVTGSNEYISAIIKGNDGKIKFYGNLKNCAAEGDASGTAKVKVDGKIGEGDTLYVLNEQLNGDKKTDLASELKEVAIPDSITHDTTHHDAVAPTCTEDGNVEYWSCGNCEKNFEDEQGTTELATIVDPKTGHDMTHHDAVAPTCTEDGNVEYWSCGNCTKNFGDEQGTTELTDIIDPKTGHSMTHHDAVAPTCTEDGNVEYWSCGNCNKNFEDEQGTTELSTIVDPKTGHKYGEWESLDEKQHQRICEHDASHVEKANHSWDAGKVTKAATCTEKGEMTFTCTVEGCEATKTEEIKAKGHTEVVDKAVPATCTEAGLTEGKHCSVCDAVLVKQETVPATGHKWDEGKVTKEATETSEGIKTYTCTVCGETKTEAIPKLKPSAPKVSGTHLAKLTAKSKSITISWNKIQGADGYDIFFARCNHDSKKFVTKKVKTIKGNKTFKWTKSSLKKGTAYKAYVRAYVTKNGKKTYVSKSPIIHAYTGNGTKKYTNAKSVKVNKTKVTLTKGKTFKIKAKVNKVNKKKKLTPKSHAPTLRYMTSNSKIASVNSGGKITAKGKGTCYIYVYAHNGVSKQIKVAVK